MRYILFAVSVVCAGGLCAMAQEATGQRPSEAGDRPARSQEERPNGTTGEKPASLSPQTPAPAPSPASPATTPAPSNENFIIGPEDVLAISVWREPDLTTRAIVRPDGKIGIPLLGDVLASGLTAKELQDRISEGLAKFLKDPLVSVVVVEIHSQMVHILGAVGRPGSYALGGPLTIVELLSRAGGLAEFSKSDEIVIVRSERGRTRRFIFNYKLFVEGKNLQQNIPLQNGDVVLIP